MRPESACNVAKVSRRKFVSNAENPTDKDASTCTYAIQHLSNSLVWGKQRSLCE